MGFDALTNNTPLFQTLTPIPAKKKIRKIYNHIQNETASISNPVFEMMRGAKTLTPEQTKIIDDPMKQVEASKEWAEIHIDRRVAAFFQQLIVCYATPFRFEVGETAHQAESSETLNQKGQKGLVSIAFNSAHSSTLPCLYAYPKTDYDQWMEKGADPKLKPKGFVYLKDSDYYRLNNSTIGLIKPINSADIAIDGKANEGKLRDISIKIINDVADRKLSPQTGLQQFVEGAHAIIAQQIKQNRNPIQKKILEYFQETVVDIKKEMKAESFFDLLINVNIGNNDGIPGLRKLVYSLRYKIIRECQEIQTVILQLINKLAADMIGVERKAPNFDIVYKLTLLKSTASHTNKVALEKLFCLSQEALQEIVDKKKTTPAIKLVNQKDNLKKISELVNDQLNHQFWDLRRKELLLRRDLFTGIRHQLNLRQVDVVAKYKTLFPRKAFSQAGVSRIENTIKVIDKDLALDLSEVFSIDPGLFFPALFTSLYS